MVLYTAAATVGATTEEIARVTTIAAQKEERDKGHRRDREDFIDLACQSVNKARLVQSPDCAI